MNAIPDHYAALGIDPTADPEVIAAAYRALAKKYHPDTGATAGTASAERFEQIQQAYEVLRSPESRRQYDLELLAQTERDLEAHLARKRRALPGVAGVPPGTPGPDLGSVRPALSTGGARGRDPATPGQPGQRRALAPFLIPAALLLVLLGAAVWLFLPRPFDASSVTVAENTAPAAKTPTPQPTAANPPAANPPATPEPAAAEATVNEPQQQPTPKADAEPVPSPTPAPAAATPNEDVQSPVFGSSETAEAPPAETEAAPPPAPVTPKPRPTKKKAPAAAPRQQAEAGSPYTLIIFERRRHGRIITEQADMFFASRGSCIEFGVKAVLRRMEARNMKPRRQRIWYECQPAS